MTTPESSELFPSEKIQSPVQEIQFPSLDPTMDQELAEKPSGDSSNLTKRDLVMKIADETGLIQTDVFKVIQKTLDHITDALANGRNVELRNFGVFEVVLRRSKPGRNPNKPEVSVIIPARATVKFKSGKIMRQRVLLRTEELKHTPAA